MFPTLSFAFDHLRINQNCSQKELQSKYPLPQNEREKLLSFFSLLLATVLSLCINSYSMLFHPAFSKVQMTSQKFFKLIFNWPALGSIGSVLCENCPGFWKYLYIIHQFTLASPTSGECKDIMPPIHSPQNCVYEHVFSVHKETEEQLAVCSKPRQQELKEKKKKGPKRGEYWANNCFPSNDLNKIKVLWHCSLCHWNECSTVHMDFSAICLWLLHCWPQCYSILKIERELKYGVVSFLDSWLTGWLWQPLPKKIYKCCTLDL